MARTLLDWDSGVLSDYITASGHDGSTVTPIESIVSDAPRFPGKKALKVVMPVQNNSLGRSYNILRIPDIPAGGGHLKKWYFMSFYLANDWNMAQVQEGPSLFANLSGFRYRLGGQHNGPQGVIQNGTQGAPQLATGAVIVTPGVALTGSEKYFDGRLVKGRWVDMLMYVEWIAAGQSGASQGVRETWCKFKTETWDQASHAVYTGPTMAWGPEDFTTASGGQAYWQVGIYQGSGVNQRRTAYYGPCVIGDTRAEVDLVAELEGGGAGVAKMVASATLVASPVLTCARG